MAGWCLSSPAILDAAPGGHFFLSLTQITEMGRAQRVGARDRILGAILPCGLHADTHPQHPSWITSTPDTCIKTHCGFLVFFFFNVCDCSEPHKNLNQKKSKYI